MHEPDPAEHDSHMIGRTVGPYRLKRILGRGGMGTVYLGEREDQEVRMQVSVKLLHRELTDSMRESFRQERQVLADLKHPHIAVLHDAGTTDDGFPYFIMEYIEGVHVDEWCAQNEPSAAELLRMIRTVATALGAAHRAGVIHRDIKPYNLMVTGDGLPKLLDFGIARMAGLEEDRASRAPMTPAYAAPEQRKGQTVTETGDIYSLALVLLQLLARCKPDRFDTDPLSMVTRLMVEGQVTHVTTSAKDSDDDITYDMTLSTDPQTTATVDTSEVEQPVERKSGPVVKVKHRQPMPEALGYVLRRALAEDPLHRYQSTDDLIAGLDRVLAGLPGERKNHPQTRKVYDAVFWNHPDDDPVIEELIHYLEQEEDLRIWQQAHLPLEEIPPGYHHLDGDLHAMDAALELSRSCLICLGPVRYGYRETPWAHNPIRRDNLAYHAEDLRLIPVLLPGAAFPEKQSELPLYLRGLAWKRFTHGLSEDDKKDLATIIRGTRQVGVDETTPTGLCPFRGLEVFREVDRHLFFGRDGLIQRICAYLEEHTMIAVLGPSGSGKSSVVQAGVIPHLREHKDAIILFAPTRHPLDELAFALASQFPSDQHRKDALLQRLQASPEALYYIGTEILEHQGTQRLCLVIDQFEEVFTLAGETPERDAFIAGLFFAIEKSAGEIAVLLTMRSDFLGKCVIYPYLNDLILEHALQVTPMKHQELAEVIEAPARLAGLALEPGLLERVLNDVAGASGELPLLEHALLELYELRRGGMLTQAAYDEIGGIEGALARRAENEFRALDELQRDILRRMFVLCLIHPGEGVEDTRRRATREELMAVDASSTTDAESPIVEKLLSRWTEARLLTGTRDEARGLDLIEVAHEALIRRWRRINEWMAQDRDTARLLFRLRQNARAWAESGHSEDLLLRGMPLYQMRDLVAREEAHLESLEKRFVAAGVALADREVLARERTERKLRQRKNLAMVATVLSLVLATLAFAMFFRSNQQKVRAESEQARAERNTLESNFNLATMFTKDAGLAQQQNRSQEAWLLALSALAQDIPPNRRLPSAVGRFVDPKMEHAARLLWTSPVDYGVNQSAFSPDGLHLALAGRDNLIRMIDLTSGGPAGLLAGHTNTVRALAFQPVSSPGTAHLLASAGEDFNLYLWRMPESPWACNKPALVLQHEATIADLAFSPRGNRLVTVTTTGIVRVWALKPGELPEPEPIDVAPSTETGVTSLAFSGSGRLLAWGTDAGTVTVLEMDSGKSRTFDGKSGAVSDLIFLGERPISAHRNGHLLLWSESGDLRHRIVAGQEGMVRLATRLAGQRFLSSGADGSLIEWDADGTRLTVHRDSIENISASSPAQTRGSLAVNPDGTMATIGHGTWMLWNLTNEGDDSSFIGKASLSGHSGEVMRVRFSPDGNLLASASIDRTVRLWNVGTGRLHASFIGHSGEVMDISFSPDGQTLASASIDRTVKVWQVPPVAEAPHSTIITECTTLSGFSGEVLTVVFSPDGKVLASSSRDRTIRLWQTAHAFPELATFTGHSGDVTSIAFAPDGQRLVSASDDETLKLWHVPQEPISNQGANHPVTLVGHSGEVWRVAFSPNGQLLASASRDKTVRLWQLPPANASQVADLKALATLVGHTAEVVNVAFSPDGTLLASASVDQTTRLWRVRSGPPYNEPTSILKGHTDSVLSVTFSPDGRYLSSTSIDQTVRLWETATGKEACSLSGHSGTVWQSAFSPNGHLLATASIDHTVKLWAVPTGASLPDASSPDAPAGEILSVAFSPDGRRLASASRDHRITLWDVPAATSSLNRSSAQRREILAGHSGTVWNVAFSSNGEMLASGSRDQTVKVWDVGDRPGRLRARFDGHDGEVWAVAFSPDRKILASASSDQTLALWDLTHNLDKPRHMTLSGHTGEVLSVAFSPNRRLLVSASRDQTIRLWQIPAGLFEADRVDGAEIKEPEAILTGHSGTIWSIDFSHDGRLLASGSIDQTVKLWDAETGALQATLMGHSGEVYRVAFSPDGHLLASASADDSIRLWDVRGRYAVAVLQANAGDANWLAFSPNGDLLISAHDDGNLHPWYLGDLEPFRRQSRDHEAWVQLHYRALFHFGYRLDGARLLPEKRFNLTPLEGYRFPRDHPYQHLMRPRPTDLKLVFHLEQSLEEIPP